MWLPLLVGGTVVVASRDAVTDGQQIGHLVAEHDITFMFATPVSWRLLLEAGWTGKPDLCALCGGEAMAVELAVQLGPLVRQLWNFYGPTETTVASTGCLVSSVQNPIPIGRPLPKHQLLHSRCPPPAIPVGVVGELYIGGDGVARGSLNRPELTGEKFLPDPFSAVPGARMYQTGDLARYRLDGHIECLGRTDHQVKIRRIRIELGEIEAALKQHLGVRQAVVVAREDRPGEKRLVAYVLPAGTPAPTRTELRALLKQHLPDYMVPAASAFTLPQLPLRPAVRSTVTRCRRRRGRGRTRSAPTWGHARRSRNS